MILLVVLAIVGLLVKHIVVSLFHRRAHSYTTSVVSPPKRYPHTDPIFGLDLALQTWRDFHNGEFSEGLRRRHRTHGATFITKTFLSGGADCLYTIDPINIRAITTSTFDAFGKSAWATEAAKHIGRGVLLNEGAAWRHSRTLLKPVFANKGHDELALLLEPHVAGLVAQMRAAAYENAGGVFDFHALSCMFTLDVVTEFLFGKSTKTLASPRDADAEDAVSFLALVREFEGPSGKFMALGALAWPGLLPAYRRLMGVVRGMKAFFRRRLDDILAAADDVGEKMAVGVSPSVFRAMKTAGLSDSEIQGELQNIFFASYDTTSTFLANLMYVLVRHPAEQQKLREEIAFLQGRPPSRKELAQMPHLRMVMMEGELWAA